MERRSWLDGVLRTILAVLATVLVVSVVARLVCLIGGWNSPEELAVALRIGAGVTVVLGGLTIVRSEDATLAASGGQRVSVGQLERYRLFIFALLAAVGLFLMSGRM